MLKIIAVSSGRLFTPGLAKIAFTWANAEETYLLVHLPLGEAE